MSVLLDWIAHAGSTPFVIRTLVATGLAGFGVEVSRRRQAAGEELSLQSLPKRPSTFGADTSRVEEMN